MCRDHIIPINLRILLLEYLDLFHVVFHDVTLLEHSQSQVASLGVFGVMLVLRTRFFALVESWALINYVFLIDLR